MGITGSMKREEGKCRALNWGKEEIKRMKEEEKQKFGCLDAWKSHNETYCLISIFKHTHISIYIYIMYNYIYTIYII